jgi:putative proteasome-type protease
MTYCVAMCLRDGLIFASDSRTNAGVDHISTFRKMHIFERPGERSIVLLNSGNLATTQSVVSLLRNRCLHEGENLLNVKSVYEAAVLVGETIREVLNRDSGGATLAQGVDYSCSFLVGGQIRGEAPRLFNIYPQGNFIEATLDTPFFQIGESKYGKPIIDRVVRHETALNEALKCTLISFDSTIKSNLSVGLPIDLLKMPVGQLGTVKPFRVDDNNAYFQSIRRAWGEGLRRVFAEIPDADWFDELNHSG